MAASRLSDIAFYAHAIEIDDYNDAEVLFKDPEFHTSAHRPPSSSSEFVGNTLNDIEGAAHMAMRRVHSHLFRRAAIVHYEHQVVLPATQNALDGLRAEKDAAGAVHVDLVQLNREILSDMACRLCGLGDLSDIARRKRFVELSGLLIRGQWLDFWTGPDRLEQRERCSAAKDEFWTEFIEPAVRVRRERLAAKAEPTAVEESLDLLTLLIADDPTISDELLLRHCFNYTSGTLQTVGQAVVWTIDGLAQWFDEHPDRANDRFDIAFLHRACAETLRLHPPIPALLRRAMMETTLPSNGCPIHAGEEVAIHLAAANRQESVFGSCPDTLDPDRELPDGVQRHGLSFGAGKHVCIGRRLALANTAAPDEANEGMMLRMLRAYYDAGIEPDRDRPPELPRSARSEYERYFAVFTNL